jgi:hypothetical protein
VSTLCGVGQRGVARVSYVTGYVNPPGEGMAHAVEQLAPKRALCGRLMKLWQTQSFDGVQSSRKCTTCDKVVKAERRKLVGSPSTPEEQYERRVAAGMIYVPGRVNKDPTTGERI